MITRTHKKKRVIVEWAMHYRPIIIMLLSCLMAFGMVALSKMKKNEFPDFTIRQGIVIAVYPGATSAEIEQQVTKPLEDYIFSYKEVKKAKTMSISRDGMAIIQVQLNDDLEDKDEFWSKFKHGIDGFKSSLPRGVLALMVKDDFGDTSALLITMESKDKTYHELHDYMDGLRDRLRSIEDVGRLNVYGMQEEQISVYLDNEKLSHYGISNQTLAINLFTKGFTTSAGRVKTADYESPIYVSKSVNNLRDVQEMIVFSDLQGHVVRLKDIATVKREYPTPDSYITNNGRKCLLLSVEMKSGKNIVKMGREVNKVLTEYEKTLPQDVTVFKITDQSKVVNESVANFLRELLIAIIAVIIVVMILMPMRVALVAASTIPISIFISFGLFYPFGIELNTVTLAALIVTLGMIVDNSIVIIDSYMEKIANGESRWHASIESTNHFISSIFAATLAISITFFPFLFTMTGTMHDFLRSFPWSITIVLMISLLVATMLVPFLQFYFIRKPIQRKTDSNGKPKASMLDKLQSGYDWLIDKCFAHPHVTIGIGVVSVIVGAFMITKLPQRLMPNAERNQFAVEIYMPTGTTLNKTAQVADSLEHILRRDKRVVSVASFKGTSSPRFQTSYAPQIGGPNYAQFIVNTVNEKATVAVLNDYEHYQTYFPEAIVRFKQMSYSQAIHPIEVRISGDSLSTLKKVADQVESTLRTMPELTLVSSDLKEPLAGNLVQLDEDKSLRLGVTNAMLENDLALRFGSGVKLASAWEGNYEVPIVLKSTQSDTMNPEDLKDAQIPVTGGLSNVPLRQIAQVKPIWNDGQISHRNGIRTLTVYSDVTRGTNAMKATSDVQKKLAKINLPNGVNITYGGELEDSNETTPQIIAALCIAVAIIFFILIFHFRKISTATLVLACLSLCLFGATVGVWIQGVDFSVTCFLGIVSLMGILVRNAIIMYDYAEELCATEHMTAHDAIYNSAKRRMRPIFLTSMAASMGVVPMILGGSGLWMPMGTVIFYGSIITMFFILTVMPVGYWRLHTVSERRRQRWDNLEKQ
jgi:multidrug efflux pump